MTRGPLYVNQLGLLHYTDTGQFTSKLDADKGYRCIGTIDLEDGEYATGIFSRYIEIRSDATSLADVCADERTCIDIREFLGKDGLGLFIWLLVPEDK